MTYIADDAAVAKVAEALKELPDNWVMCRDLRHAWTVDDDFHVTLKKGQTLQEVGRDLVCLRCGTGRIETYQPTTRWGLEKVRSHYVYPANYQIKGVPRGVKPQSIVQAEQYRRTMEKIAALQREHDQSQSQPVG